MTRRFGAQLPETFDFRHRQIVSAQMEPDVKKHAAVTGGEDEIITTDPARFVGVMFQRVTVKYSAHFGAAERKPEMTRLRCLHRIHAQAARFIGRARKNLYVQTHATFIAGAPPWCKRFQTRAFLQPR